MPQPAEPRLMVQMQQALRSRHYSRRTEQAYCLWTRRYIRFHGMRHPAEMAEHEINAYVTHLAVDGHVSASTQTQALSALLFLYRKVLGIPVGELTGLVRAKNNRRIPVVLDIAEVRTVLEKLDGAEWLMASIMYGSGLRPGECLHLRVLDIDFGRGEITVHDGKGGKDRVTMLPESLHEPLGQHLRRVKHLHDGVR
jgi:integrase